MKLVIHNPNRYWGGGEKWTALVGLGMRQRGHEVIISCRAGGPLEHWAKSAGIRTTAVRPGGHLDLYNGARFSRWVRREAPDTILEVSLKRLPWIALAAGRRGGPRVVVRLGVNRDFDRRGRYARAFRRRVDAIIVNSEEIRRTWLASASGLDPAIVHLVHNGIVPPRPEQLRGSEAFRAELGITESAPLVVGIGSIFAVKGFDLLIRAFARAAVPAGHLAIVGTGAQEPELRKLAGRLGVGPRVHWPGFRADVPRILAAADVFVLSSRSEGMANVMLEAMAVGTPVVATRVSGVEYALSGSEDSPPAGWIVPVGDERALADAVGGVLWAARSDPALVRSRVEEGKRRIRERFGLQRMFDELEGILQGPG